MIKKTNILFALLIIAFSATAQQNRCYTVLDNLSEKYSKSGGVTAKFTAKVKSGDKTKAVSSGTIKLMGEKFVLKTDYMESGYYKKTLWTYLISSNELNLSTPDQEELSKINPYNLLKSYKKRFTCSYGGKRNNIESVLLKPIKADDDIKIVKIDVDGIKLYPTRIEITNKNGSKTEITIGEYKTQVNLSDSSFVFDKSKHPNVEIIDLR